MGNVIHSLTDANFSAYSYTQIFTSESAVVTLNGTEITITPPMKLDIRITTCESSTPDSVFLIGGLTYYSGTSIVDILTGKPFINE